MKSIRHWFGQEDRDISDVYRDLRHKALTITSDQLGTDIKPDRAIIGVIMDIGTKHGAATLVCLADGTVSLYLSNGGGMIGVGTRDEVRVTAEQLLDWVNLYATDFIAACSPGPHLSIPRNGRVHFNLVTRLGTHSAVCAESALVAQEDPFANLFVTCNHVLSEIRRLDESQSS